jgi:hypothetical protein
MWLMARGVAGTGKQHIMGTSLPDSSPELHDQALRAIFWSMLISESSQSLHPPLVHRLHDPPSFDIYVMVRRPRVPGIGLAILCSLLAVAFDQTIDPSVLLAAVGDGGLFLVPADNCHPVSSRVCGR